MAGARTRAPKRWARSRTAASAGDSLSSSSTKARSGSASTSKSAVSIRATRRAGYATGGRECCVAEAGTGSTCRSGFASRCRVAHSVTTRIPPLNPTSRRSRQSRAPLRHSSAQRRSSTARQGSSECIRGRCNSGCSPHTHRRTVLRDSTKSRAMWRTGTPCWCSRMASPWTCTRLCQHCHCSRCALVIGGGASGSAVDTTAAAATAGALEMGCAAARSPGMFCFTASSTAALQFSSKCHRSATWTASGAPRRPPSA